MLFTFPSRYWFTIGLPGVFSLAGWSRRVHTGFLVPRITQDTAINIIAYVYRTITLLCVTFQILPLHNNTKYRSPTTPDQPKLTRFGLVPFRSPLLWESLLFSFPPVT